MNEVATAEAIAQLPLAALLALALLALHRGWIVTRGRFEDMRGQVAEMRKDRDYWRSVSLRALGVAEKATERDSGASVRDGD